MIDVRRINEIFTYNQHFVAMMNIINSSRLNTPESGHKHHIIPKCWFIMHNLPIDNSDENIVLLTKEDHIKVHKLSILCAATPEMKSKMGYAVHRLLNGNFSGIQHSEETKKKMSEAHKGKHHTEESRKKMSEAHKGKESWIKGKHLYEETRNKLSESHKGKVFSIEHCRKLSEAHKGKHRSDEAKRKISEARKGKTWKLINKVVD